MAGCADGWLAAARSLPLFDVCLGVCGGWMGGWVEPWTRRRRSEAAASNLSKPAGKQRLSKRSIVPLIESPCCLLPSQSID